mmetsp:Transcript_5117/g.15306  ORF Transcript_5117/g.15306 Transcript_5117/m.15306 type:complete len:121 (+) Transcript_5117:1429-1791(+)
MFFIRQMTVNAVFESRPDVGSSRRMTAGSMRSSLAMLTRFLSPPEIPFLNSPSPIIVLAVFVRFNFFSTSVTLASFSVRVIVSGSLTLAVKVRMSFTVRFEKKRSSCVTYATFLLVFLSL